MPGYFFGNALSEKGINISDNWIFYRYMYILGLGSKSVPNCMYI